MTEKKFNYERGFKLSLFIFSIIASIIFSFTIGFGLINHNGFQILLGIVFFIVTWLIYESVKRNNIVAFWLSLVISTIFWFVLLLQTTNRIFFIMENGGMERADGQGSPLAFLIGMVIELLFFIPLCFVVSFGWHYCFNKYFKK